MLSEKILLGAIWMKISDFDDSFSSNGELVNRLEIIARLWVLWADGKEISETYTQDLVLGGDGDAWLPTKKTNSMCCQTMFFCHVTAIDSSVELILNCSSEIRL